MDPIVITLTPAQAAATRQSLQTTVECLAGDRMGAAKGKGTLWRIPGHDRLFRLWELGFSAEQVVAHYS